MSTTPKATKHRLRGDKERNIWLDDEPLDPKPSQERRNHSPDGFSWGYGGSGPAQLALAIVMKLTGGRTDDYQRFKWEVIAGIKGDEFEIEFEWPLPEKENG